MSIRFEWRGNTDTEDLLAVPNNQTPTFTAAPPTPPIFEFHGPDNKPMVTIRHTGEVELAPGLEISEASRLFWQGLADAFPAWRRAAIDAAPEAPQPAIPPGYKLVPESYLSDVSDMVSWLQAWRRASLEVGKLAADASDAIDAMLAAANKENTND